MGGPLPLGVVLAGGRARRLGGGKAVVKLCGRSLISYPIATLRAVLPEVVVVAKRETALPRLAGTTVWVEPEPLHHPVVGIRTALEMASGRSVLVSAVDLPLVSPAFVRRLVSASPESAPAAVATHKGAIQPLLGRYSPRALEPLRRADPGAPLRKVVEALSPAMIEVEDPLELFNVNTSADLERAAALLCGPGANPRSPTSFCPAE